MQEDPERWLRHGPMTEPGSQAGLFDGLPTEIGALCRIVQGVLIHTDWISAYGLPEPLPAPSRETLPLSRRLRRIAEADPRPLSVQRSAGNRSPGTCRDFALMLCGILRQQGVPARVRCGFAAYFYPDCWEDHWICERWSPSDRRWRMTDPQIDDTLARRLDIRFDAGDIPPGMFLSACDVWRRCRAGAIDPAICGHGAERGLWFLRVNVLRDHLALTRSVVSTWDLWRIATDPQKTLTDAELEMTDRIALQPAASVATEPAPPWLA